jgi:hypothetical protein
MRKCLASAAVDRSTAGKTRSFSNIFLSNARATIGSTDKQAGKFRRPRASIVFPKFFCVLV